MPLACWLDISEWRAIDPLALLLSGEVYVKLTLPDPPLIEVIRAQAHELARSASKAEKRRALNRVRAFRAYAQAVEQALGATETAFQKGIGDKEARTIRPRRNATTSPIGRKRRILRWTEDAGATSAFGNSAKSPWCARHRRLVLIRFSVRRPIYASQQQCCRECTTPERL